jgi:predicted tellurium resistance membrane protein TerC
MDFLLDPNLWIAFAMLTALEIVLGIDNIIFISILVGRLPPELRDKARRLGLGFAMVSRLLLLFSLSWVMGLTDDLFNVVGQGISGRDLVLLLGGLFLLWKASHEIFVEVEAMGEDQPGAQPDAAALKAAGNRLFWAIIGQIAVIDIVFSLDSVITAVGMVDEIGVMVAAVVTSVGVMLVAAKPIGEFVDRHPSVKVRAQPRAAQHLLAAGAVDGAHRAGRLDRREHRASRAPCRPASAWSCSWSAPSASCSRSRRPRTRPPACPCCWPSPSSWA